VAAVEGLSMRGRKGLLSRKVLLGHAERSEASLPHRRTAWMKR
jgi:hypothetical protein